MSKWYAGLADGEIMDGLIDRIFDLGDCDVTELPRGFSARLNVAYLLSRLNCRETREPILIGDEAEIEGVEFTVGQFRALMDLLMRADPWPVNDDGVSLRELAQLANDAAYRLGYVDWVDAYHRNMKEDA